MAVKEDQGRPSRLRQWFPSGQAEPGSKLWYRDKRIEHCILWMMPLMPLGYTLSSQGTGMPWPVLVWMLVPVVGAGTALACASYALWRIEINVSGNREHPFTKKDHRVLGWSAYALLFGVAFAIGADAAAHLILSDTPDEQLRYIDSGANIAIVASMTAAVFTATMGRIHCKAKHAYEELEKGV